MIRLSSASFRVMEFLHLFSSHRSLSEKIAALAKTFPSTATPISLLATTVVVVFKHLRSCCESYRQSVDYVEHLLRTQLIAAIGKEVTSSEGFLRVHGIPQQKNVQSRVPAERLLLRDPPA
jgi:hypothetical protein